MKNDVNVFTCKSHIINIRFYICASATINHHVPDEFVNFAENKVAKNYSGVLYTVTKWVPLAVHPRGSLYFWFPISILESVFSEFSQLEGEGSDPLKETEFYEKKITKRIGFT